MQLLISYYITYVLATSTRLVTVNLSESRQEWYTDGFRMARPGVSPKGWAPFLPQENENLMQLLIFVFILRVFAILLSSRNVGIYQEKMSGNTSWRCNWYFLENN